MCKNSYSLRLSSLLASIFTRVFDKSAFLVPLNPILGFLASVATCVCTLLAPFNSILVLLASFATCFCMGLKLTFLFHKHSRSIRGAALWFPRLSLETKYFPLHTTHGWSANAKVPYSSHIRNVIPFRTCIKYPKVP